ncbi:hypothetical protein M569_06375, partial [Genlisea aurea]
AFLFFFALLTLLSVLLQRAAAAGPYFEGFDAEDEEDFAVGDSKPEDDPISFRLSPPPTISLSASTPESDHGPPDPEIQSPADDRSSVPNPRPASSFEYWDEDEFEGFTQEFKNPSDGRAAVAAESDNNGSDPDQKSGSGGAPEEVPELGKWKRISSYSVEIACISFLIVFAINYFTGKKENENLALAWASKFAVKDSIFDKNFSLLGVGETDDSPLLLKEGQNVFKFYASGRRFCSGLLATMELKSRHDLISRLYNAVVPSRDEITFEVYMNDDAMDHVIFALARKKLAKAMLQKEVKDLHKFAALVSPPGGRKWVADELQVVAESKEVAAELITEAVLDQVLGEKSIEKFGNGFISMHFSDQNPGASKKMLVFKFSLPDAAHRMSEMTRLVSLVPYYIDLIGRFKLSPHVRSKTEAARSKAAQEAAQKELQNARQEAAQKKKAADVGQLSAEAIRRKEAKDRAKQMKKAMPKLKMTRA